MGRRENPGTQFRVRKHVNGGYTYASTQPPYIDPNTGAKKYHHVHWGTVDENLKFIPGSLFYQASPEERARLIFPEEWDMSEVKKFADLREPCRPVYDDDERNRFYGDIWLLEQIAAKTGIRRDLEVVFDRNCEIVDDIMTLAMFTYLTKFDYSRVARWQQVAVAPSSRELTPQAITLLTHYIGEQHRTDLLRLRAARLGNDELCAVDSTSRSEYGWSLADIRWGKNSDRLPLGQTTEVVVYTLSSHLPVYYRSFPGNMPDFRSIETILRDLENAGFKDTILITDRGYESMRDLEKYILRGHRMVTCAKTERNDVVKAINGLGEFNDRPEEMVVDPKAMVYHKQFGIDYEAGSAGQATKMPDRLKLNLYFDPLRRALDQMGVDIAMSFQEAALGDLFMSKEILGDDAWIEREFCYYKVDYDPATRVIKSFAVDECKVSKAQRLSGFFAIMTHGVGFDAMAAFRAYRLRDEQEKFFQRMMDQIAPDRLRDWSGDGRTGRLFILFVSLILSSHVHHVWGSTKLRELFSSSLDVIDEMRPIRLVERTDGVKVITPFAGA